jgi:hypothetical protein
VTRFDFITSEEFRQSLESDFREMSECINAGAWKATHVLAGSIVEAVLIDYLLAENHISLKDALKADLGSAITLCQAKRIISEQTVDLSTVIKGYRNLIHPGRQIRLNEQVDVNSAKVAEALVQMVLKEVSLKKRATYGYTAEQIVSKLERDTSAAAIMPHLLKATNPTEIERLLISVVPEAYLSHLDDEDGYGPEVLCPLLESCFHMAFDLAPDELKARVTNRFVAVLKEERGQIVRMHGTAFFRASHLEHLAADDAGLVMEHLLSRLREDSNGEFLSALEGIGAFLRKEDVSRFVDPLVRLIVSSTSTHLAKGAQGRLESAWIEMPKEIDQKVIKRVEVWIKSYRDKKQEAIAKRLETISFLNDIPF